MVSEQEQRIVFEQEQCLLILHKNSVSLLNKNNVLVVNKSNQCLVFEQQQCLVSEQEQCLVYGQEQSQEQCLLLFDKNKLCLWVLVGAYWGHLLVLISGNWCILLLTGCLLGP